MANLILQYLVSSDCICIDFANHSHPVTMDLNAVGSKHGKFNAFVCQAELPLWAGPAECIVVCLEVCHCRAGDPAKCQTCSDLPTTSCKRKEIGQPHPCTCIRSVSKAGPTKPW